VGDSIREVSLQWKNCSQFALEKTIQPDGRERTGAAATGFRYTKNAKKRVFTLRGAPSEEGDWLFILKMTGNVNTPDEIRDTIIIHATDPTAITETEEGELKMENYYDLSGRKLLSPKRGIAIRRGKKFIMTK